MWLRWEVRQRFVFCPLCILMLATRFVTCLDISENCTWLAYAGDNVASGCRSLVEGVPKKILWFEVLVSVSLPQTAPLRDLASGKLLLQCLAIHPLISRWFSYPITSSAWLLHGLALMAYGRPSALGGFARSASGRS
jgi:hypothetical protein